MRASYTKVLCEEPFRLFFPLGVGCSALGVGHWIAYITGLIPHYSGYYHGLVQLQGFELAFAAGFLMTAMPRIIEVDGARLWEVIVGLALVVGGVCCLSFDLWIPGEICFIALVLHLWVFALRRYPSRQDNPPPVFIFLAFGLTCALAGGVLIIRPLASFHRLGQELVMEGMMLGLVLGAGAYLLPRLLYQERGDPATSGPAARRQVLTYIPVCLLLAASFLLDTGVSARLGYLLRASVTTGCLVWVMRLYRLPTRRLIHVWMLWAAAWCVPAGFWLTALLPDFRVAAMHLTFAGGFGLMTLIVATRVVVAHCGFESLWDRNSLAVGAVVVLAALATVVRVFVDVYYEAYWELAFVAAALWLAATLIWGILFIPKQAPWHISED